MWEYSINLKDNNSELANVISNSLSSTIKSFDGVVTSHEENGYISILVGVDEKYSDATCSIIVSCITEIICTKFKWNFLDKRLYLPEHDEIGMLAFKKALLNFDKETDKFIVKKNLDLNKDLFLESFYHFKLQTLKNKWEELVTLSNENREYLISSDSFIDLLKFLVDNLDICEEEISIVKEKEGYKIYTEDEKQYLNKVFSEDLIVSSVIDLSPQKINLYCEDSSVAINLLERLFEERIVVNKPNLKCIHYHK